MDPSLRPPPCILILHDGNDLHAHIQHLEAAGLRVVEAEVDGNLIGQVLSINPDLIVLDYDIDGDTVERLKDDRRTMQIPVIALAELALLPRSSAGLEESQS